MQKPTVNKASPTPAVHRSGSGANLSRADSVHALIAEVQAENGVVNCHGSVEDEVLRTYMCRWFLPGYVGSLKAWHEALGSNEHSGRGNMVAAPLSSFVHHHQGKTSSSSPTPYLSIIVIIMFTAIVVITIIIGTAITNIIISALSSSSPSYISVTSA